MDLMKSLAVAASGLRTQSGRMRIIAENLGVRQVRFLPAGGVVDDGLFVYGAGLASIVGAIGVQP